MRWLAAWLMMLMPAAGTAQSLATMPPLVYDGPRLAQFNAAGPYITAGQDEPGYRRWLMARPDRSPLVAAFHNYLESRGVAGIVPTWQLLRTATMWSKCGADPFEVPPPAEWPNLVETLAYVRDHVIPVVGPVEPVSVYRNPTLNVCAGGAAESAHRHFNAIDMVPLRATTRDALMRGLCAIHSWQGSGYAVGLGFYIGLRFHIDSTRFRKWGAALGDENSIGCPQVMADIAARAAASNVPPAPAPVAPVDPLSPKK